VAAGSHLPVTLLHADVDEQSFALRGQVLEAIRSLPAGRIHVWYEQGGQTSLPVDGVHEGVMDVRGIDLPADAIYYLCGPLAFMQAVRSALVERGVPPRDIQYEVFGPDLWQADLATEASPGEGHRRHAA
jgi:nitric oxide dioxygenase